MRRLKNRSPEIRRKNSGTAVVIRPVMMALVPLNRKEISGGPFTATTGVLESVLIFSAGTGLLDLIRHLGQPAKRVCRSAGSGCFGEQADVGRTKGKLSKKVSPIKMIINSATNLGM